MSTRSTKKSEEGAGVGAGRKRTDTSAHQPSLVGLDLDRKARREASPPPVKGGRSATLTPPTISLREAPRLISSSVNLKISSQKDTLMQSLIHFFHKREHIDELLPIIEGSSKISLRILDWFVTNYSKKHGVAYSIGDKRFMVYISYKAQLKAYQKKNFDPFCRRERIKFIVHGGKEVITTVGQLNFFRWAIENRIVKYIGDHYNDIEKDMNDSLKNMYKKKEEDEKTKRRKRRQLSVSAVKTVNKHNTSIVVSFN